MHAHAASGDVNALFLGCQGIFSQEKRNSMRIGYLLVAPCFLQRGLFAQPMHSTMSSFSSDVSLPLWEVVCR